MADGGRRLPVLGAYDGAGASPVFTHVAIAGLGTVGASLALAWRRAWPSALVIGCDRNEVLEAAVRRGIIDVGADDPVIAGGADLVVLAGEPGWSATVRDRLADVIQGQAVVLYLYGATGALEPGLLTLPERFSLIAGRIVPAPAESGLSDAAAGLLQGRAWHLAALRAEAACLERVEQAVRAAGAAPVRVSPGDFTRLATESRAAGGQPS